MALVKRVDFGKLATWGCTDCAWEIDVPNPQDPSETPQEVRAAFNSHRCKTREISFPIDKK